MKRSAPHGFTIIELIVTIVLLGVLASVAAVAITASPRTQDTPDNRDAIQRARAEAVRSGTRVTITMRGKSGRVLLTAFPDGSVAADSALQLDPLTGAPIPAAH